MKTVEQSALRQFCRCSCPSCVAGPLTRGVEQGFIWGWKKGVMLPLMCVKKG